MRTRMKKNMLGLLLTLLLLVAPAMALASTINFSGVDDLQGALLDAMVTIDGSAVIGVSFTIGGMPINLTNIDYAEYNPGVNLTLGGHDASWTFSIDYFCIDPYGENEMIADNATTQYFVSASNLTSDATCVPLPGAVVLLGSGLVGLLGLRRKP